MQHQLQTHSRPKGCNTGCRERLVAEPNRCNTDFMQQCNGFRDVDLDVDMVHWLQTSITRCRHIPMANRHAALAIRTNLNSQKVLVRFLKFLTFLYPSYPSRQFYNKSKIVRHGWLKVLWGHVGPLGKSNRCSTWKYQNHL